MPLAKAHEQGYYDRTVLLIRNLFEKCFEVKRQPSDCRADRMHANFKGEHLTGLNNLRVLGVADERFYEYFGFTDQEVKELLAYYDMSDKYEEVREWYDGYRFGIKNVYCPWDVINYIDTARFGTNPFPENYWINSSGNNVAQNSSGKATVYR